MPDPRSVMKEFRFLDQKRQTEGLTADEELRYGELRDLVGGETNAAASKPGFDVNAAAARLRESLLPAGLRNRPPPAPELSPEPFGEIDPPAEEPVPLPTTYEEQPYAGQEQAQAGEGLFDPGSLAEEGAYDPNAYAAYDPNAAAGYDPNAATAYDPNAYAAYDPNAAAGYDPNAAAAYDPNAYAAYDPNAAAAYDPNAYAAYDPNAAAAYDPNAAAAYDPNAATAYDPNAATAYDPNAYAAYDPNAAAAYDPNAAAAYDPNAYAAYDPNAAAAYDPNAAAAYDPNAAAAYDPHAAAAYDPHAAAAYDPNAAAAYDPNAASAYDPNAAAAYDPNAAAAYDPNAAAGYDPNAASAYDPNAAAAYDPNAAAAYDPNAAAAYDPNAASAYDPNAVGAATDHPVWADATGEAADPAVPSPQSGEPAWAPVPGGDYDGASWDAQFADPAAIPAPAEEQAMPAPGPVEFGGYDDAAEPGAFAPEPQTDLESLLPFDPAAEARVGPEMAEAFAGGEPLELPGGEGLADEHEFHAEATAPAEAPEWQAEPAVIDQGFELASGGSFDARADAAAPEWASAPSAALDAAGPSAWDPPAPGEHLAADDGYTSAPAPDATAAASLDFSAPELTSEGDAADLSWAGNPGNETAFPAPAHEHDAFEVSEDPDTLPPIALGGPGEEAVPAGPLDFGLPGDAPTLDLGAPAGHDSAFAAEDIPTIDADAMIEEVPADIVIDGAEDAAPAPMALPYDAPADAHAPAPEPTYALPPEDAYTPAPEAAAYALAPEDAYAPAPEPAYAAAPEPTYAPAPEPAPPAAHEADLPLDVIEAPEPEILDPGVPAEDFYVAGAHRVVVHTLEGQVKRGFIENADLAAPDLDLAATQGGPVEPVPSANVKAIFFMLAPGEQPVPPHGSRVRITFRDGRQVAGFSPDYREGAFGFYVFPADARTSTERIWVYQAAVKQVSVS